MTLRGVTRGRPTRAFLALGSCVLVAALGAGTGSSAAPNCGTYDPAWSPDGSRIAFGADQADGTGLIETINPAGTVLHVLTQAPAATSTAVFKDDFGPTWAADGVRLAFVRSSYLVAADPNYPDWTLNVLDTSTGAMTQVADQAARPTWSRTGLLGYQLYDSVHDFAGFVAGSRTFLNPSPFDVERAGPSWAPDGRFAFEADTSDSSRIYVVNRNGRRRLLVVGSDPKWSPNGRWIAYIGPSGTRFNVISPDGRQRRHLLTVSDYTAVDHSAVWSPGGARIAIGTTVVTLANGKARDLPVDANEDSDPSWSPDGQRLVYSSSGGLQLIRPNGTGLRAIDPCGLTPS